MRETDHAGAAGDAGVPSTASPPCLHEGAVVDAYLGSPGEALPWTVPKHLLSDPYDPDRSDDVGTGDAGRGERLELLGTRTGDVALGRCGTCGQQVVSVRMHGPAERRVETGPDGSFIDYGTPSWSTRWTAITRPAGYHVEARSIDVEQAGARVLEVLLGHGVNLGADTALLAKAAALATLTGDGSYRVEDLRRHQTARDTPGSWPE